MLITVAVSTYSLPKLLREVLASIAALAYFDRKATPTDYDEWSAIKLAVRLFLPHNYYSSPVH